jgi:hypothetical protein
MGNMRKVCNKWAITVVYHYLLPETYLILGYSVLSPLGDCIDGNHISYALCLRPCLSYYRLSIWCLGSQC